MILTDLKAPLYSPRMAVDRREVLQRVADGELTPEDADRLLSDAADPSPPPTDAAVRCVKISVGVGGIEIVGDPTVAHAEVEGPHRAEIEGDTLVVHGEWEPGEDGFSFRLGRHGRRRGFVHVDPQRGERKLSRLRMRVNPHLDVDVELDAGPVSISGMEAGIRARVAAGPITIEDFTGELDVAVNAGAVRAVGRLTEGESRIRSDAGAIRVELDSSSSVRIVAQAALGKVMVPGSEEHTRRRFAGDRREAVIGDGTATLRAETAMGSVHVTTR